MKFIPYLDFDGNCKEAFDFYAAVFEGRITMCMRYGESPIAGEMPPATHDRIMHSQLETAHGTLMGSDGSPQSPSSGGWVNLQVDTPAEAERVFEALGEGASIRMPLTETFWAERFGMLTDRYGKAWMVNCMKSPAV